MLLTIYYTKSAVSILASVNFAFTVNCILKSGVEPSLLVSFLSSPSISVTYYYWKQNLKHSSRYHNTQN
jgi:hypothetical protein